MCLILRSQPNNTPTDKEKENEDQMNKEKEENVSEKKEELKRNKVD